MRKWITTQGTVIYRICMGRSNAYLVLGREHGCVLVDTGKKRPVESLARLIGSLTADPIDAIILTHSHYDHAENAAALKRYYRAPIVIHRQDAAFLERGDSPIPRGSLALTRIVTTLFSNLVQPFFRYEGVSPDFEADDRFDLGRFGMGGYLLHTPGHSRGSMSVIIDDDIAIVGDAMMGVYPESIFIPFADDISGMVASWKTLLDTNCRIFLPGHGGANGAALVQRQYERYRKRFRA